MFSWKRESPRGRGYWEQLQDLLRLMGEADSVALGIGAGMSASGGLDYTGPWLAQQWFPEYAAQGCATLAETVQLFRRPRRNMLESYWGYWARHIQHIGYEYPVTRPYLDLRELIRGRLYFICTANTDGQLEKAGFPREKIFTALGDYRYFHCYSGCADDLWDNREMIRRMLDSMPTATEIRSEDIPRCPRCGGYLVPNLTIDDLFAPQPRRWNEAGYREFLEDAADRRLLLLELGAGPGSAEVIRYPFEEMARQLPYGTLVRVNLTRPQLPPAVRERGLSIQEDIGKVLQDLLYLRTRETGL